MFDQSTITDVSPPTWDGSALHLEWTSSAPDGTTFQVYVGRALSWHGTSRWVAIPMPASRLRIDIGTVGPGEDAVDFSGLLPPSPADRAELSWLGGTYLDPTGNDDVAGFRIHGASAPGGAIDYTRALDEIPAYPGGIVTHGYGLGGYGQGGYGRAASTYRWTSPSLRAGTWPFAVVSYDAAGNPGVPALTSVSIASSPRSPAPFPDGSRLKYAYDPADRTVTLSWLPSPSTS
jgi:hypothetical protein